MPSPIAHIYYAREYLARNRRKDSAAFLRGTIFPDVRYIANIDRAITHRRDVSLAEVAQCEDDWTAGVLLHCWVDEAWMAYFEQYGLDPEDQSFDGQRTALKLMEDEQLQRLLDSLNIKQIALGLEGGVEGANYGVAKVAVGNWNELVASLLRAKDTKEARELIMKAMHIAPIVIKRLEEREARMHRSMEWPERVRDCRRVVIEMF